MFKEIVFHRTELREPERTGERLRAANRVSVPARMQAISGGRQSLA
jgi:hypothetical protein